VSGFEDKSQLFESGPWLVDDSFIPADAIIDGNGQPEAYIPIRSDRIDEPNTKRLREFLHVRTGIIFLKDGSPIKLS
ncbi:hypothetical protein OFN43_34080, partial [Escherichia coli]|nr:hypothetical protein [Escherichia coli]